MIGREAPSRSGFRCVKHQASRDFAAWVPSLIPRGGEGCAFCIPSRASARWNLVMQPRRAPVPATSKPTDSHDELYHCDRLAIRTPIQYCTPPPLFLAIRTGRACFSPPLASTPPRTSQQHTPPPSHHEDPTPDQDPPAQFLAQDERLTYQPISVLLFTIELDDEHAVKDSHHSIAKCNEKVSMRDSRTCWQCAPADPWTAPPLSPAAMGGAHVAVAPLFFFRPHEKHPGGGCAAS